MIFTFFFYKVSTYEIHLW